MTEAGAGIGAALAALYGDAGDLEFVCSELFGVVEVAELPTALLLAQRWGLADAATAIDFEIQRLGGLLPASPLFHGFCQGSARGLWKLH